MLYGAFASSVSGMLAQSESMNTIGINVANVNTGGYKRKDTQFQTLLSKPIDSDKALGGVNSFTRSLIAEQGFITSSSRSLDIAINGPGFFVLNSLPGGEGETLYGRDGSLFMAIGDRNTFTDPNNGTTTDYNEAFLIDKNGYYLRGYSLDVNGNATGSLQDLRVDPWAFTNMGQATTNAELGANLPADLAANNVRTTYISAYDSSGYKEVVSLTFTRLATPHNTWTLDADVNNGAITSPVTETLTFNGDGSINTPETVTFTGTSSAGNPINFELDISTMTQFAGSFQEVFYTYNGNSEATMVGITFSQDGKVVGLFSDSTRRPIYQLPLATFANPNGLDEINGNVYRESAYSGEATMRSDGNLGVSQLVANALEGSNVELQDEFTKMLITQQAYNASANVFRTADEMVTVIRDLK